VDQEDLTMSTNQPTNQPTNLSDLSPVGLERNCVNQNNFFVGISRQLLKEGHFPKTEQGWIEALGDFANQVNFELLADIEGGQDFERQVNDGDAACVFAAIQSVSNRRNRGS
jgi:hypothetical protein